MEPSPLAKRYLNNINWIGPRDGERLDKDKLAIQCDDLAKNIHHFVYNGTVIRRKNRLIISYLCTTCDRENIIALNNVISKIERNIGQCSTCRGVGVGVGIGVNATIGDDFVSCSDTELRTKIIQDKVAFDAMDDAFKERYYSKLMRQEAFENIRGSILGYQYGKFTNIDDVQYVPNFRPTPNPKFFQPMFYDRSRDTIETPKFVTLECAFCSYKFITKDIAPYRNKSRVFCKMCAVEFGPTKPRYEKGLIYRTKFQHKFIKFCIKHGIGCLNGPKAIPFTHGRTSVEHETGIHYFIPDARTVVDVVGNLEYQDELCSRTHALKSYAEQNGWKYVMLHPKNYVMITRTWKNEYGTPGDEVGE